MSVKASLAHKMRSVLTMLGIIIGIASVVSVVALGRGSQEKIIANISSMGTNTINVYPGQGFGDRKSDKVKTLTVADSDVLGKQSYIDSATPNTTAAGTLVYRNITVNAQLSGVGEQYFDVKGLKPAEGRFFNRDDVRANHSYVVIDDNTRKKLFPNGGDPVGQVLLFNRQPLEIIAVAEQQDSVFGPTDTLNLWAPYTTVMNKITGQRHISSVIVKVKDNVMPLMAEKNLTALLVLGLGGCANYPMGSLKTDLLPAEDVAASYSLNTAWWKGYHDADLDRIVALALERNVDLALSAIKVNRALYQARPVSYTHLTLPTNSLV